MTDAGVEDLELEKYVHDRVELYHAHVAASKEAAVEPVEVVAVPIVPKSKAKAKAKVSTAKPGKK